MARPVAVAAVVADAINVNFSSPKYWCAINRTPAAASSNETSEACGSRLRKTMAYNGGATRRVECCYLLSHALALSQSFLRGCLVSADLIYLAINVKLNGFSVILNIVYKFSLKAFESLKFSNPKKCISLIKLLQRAVWRRRAKSIYVITNQILKLSKII